MNFPSLHLFPLRDNVFPTHFEDRMVRIYRMIMQGLFASILLIWFILSEKIRIESIVSRRPRWKRRRNTFIDRQDYFPGLIHQEQPHPYTPHHGWKISLGIAQKLRSQLLVNLYVCRAKTAKQVPGRPLLVL